jgi:hypothetical protein
MSRHKALQSRPAHVEQPAGDTHVAHQRVAQVEPGVYFIAEVALRLKVSRRTIEKLRRHRCFPIPELPSLDKRPRWARVEIEKFLASGSVLKLRRRSA